MPTLNIRTLADPTAENVALVVDLKDIVSIDRSREGYAIIETGDRRIVSSDPSWSDVLLFLTRERDES